MASPDDNPCLSDFAEHTRHLFVDVAQAGAIAKGGRPARRAVFRKTHGVVYGRMLSDPRCPDELRQGLFDGQDHDVWIRFSSDVAPDETDANNGTIGIGIKIFGINGPTLADIDPSAPTADLVLQNHDVFFVDTGLDMCMFTDLALKGRIDEWFAAHPETKKILGDMAKREESALAATYWSVLPYACGTATAVKYRLTPHSRGSSEAPDSDVNRLRTDLGKRLAATGASFTLEIQKPAKGAALPTDKATERWSEADAPFVAVARIEIPPQNPAVEGQETYGDTLAFSPWRVPPANRPLGSIAESRRLAYPSSAAKRHYVAHVETEASSMKAYVGGGATIVARVAVDATGRVSALSRRLGAKRIVVERIVAERGSAGRASERAASPTWLEVEGSGASWSYGISGPGGRHERWHVQRGNDRRAPPRGKRADASSAGLSSAAGEGWLAVGDAATSFDPVTSQGLVNALATAVAAGLLVSPRGLDAEAVGIYSGAVAATFRNSEKGRAQVYEVLHLQSRRLAEAGPR